METIESMLKNCAIDTKPQILVYIEGDSNDGDEIGSLATMDFTKENLDYLRVINYIYCHDFRSEYWEEKNPFSQYGIGDNDDKDETEVDSEDLLKIKLNLIYWFLYDYLPSVPDWGGKCHSVTAFNVFIISPQCSGELMYEDISDEEIIKVWKDTK